MFQKPFHKHLIALLALLGGVASFSGAHAQTASIVGQWIRQTGGDQSWSTPASWNGGFVPITAGDIANLTADITANQRITLGGGQTIGVINLGDLSSSQVYTIGVQGTDILNFNNQFWSDTSNTYNLGARAMLNKVQGGADIIAADILMVSDLAIYNRTAFTITGDIGDGGAGKSLVKMGTTNMTLTGSTSFSGDFVINTSGGTTFLSNTNVSNQTIQSSLIRLGNSSYDGGTTVALTLGAGNQISDTTSIRFDGAGGREAFFRLAGFSETIANISDYTNNGVIENTHASNASTLTLQMTGGDSFYNGYFRNGSTGTLALVKNGTAELTLAGGRISYTGDTTVNAGRLVLSNLGNNVFGSAINLVTGATSLELNATADYVLTRGVSGPGSTLKTGTSTVTWTGVNAAAGTFTGSEGTVRLSGANGAISSASSIALSSGGTILISNRVGGGLTGGKTTSGSATITVGDTSNLAVGMSVSGSNIPAGAVITSIASGTQFNISANATATGSSLSFSAVAANNNNRINDAAPISMNGGNIRFDNGGGANTYTETLGALALNGGINTITAGRTGTNADPTNSTLTFAGFSRSAKSALNFLNASTTGGQSLGLSTANRVMFNSGISVANLATGGIIGGWATVGNDWATYGANGVTALSSYSKIIGGNTNTYGGGVSSITVTDATGIVAGMGVSGSNNIQAGTTVLSVVGNTVNLSLPTTGAGGNNPVFGTYGLSQNVNITTVTASGTNSTVNFWAPSGTQVASINIKDTAARTFALNGREIIIGSGGVLSSGADHVIGVNNQLTAGAIKVLPSTGISSGLSELIFTVNDSGTRTLTVFAQLSDNGATPMTVVKSGPGRLLMTPAVTNNSYTGGTTVLGGTIEIKDRANLGTNQDSNFLVLNGGGLELATNSTITIQNTGTRQITIGPNGGRLELDFGETLNFGNDVPTGLPVTGTGRLTVGAADATGGIINMNGPLSVTGGLTVAAGTLNLNNPNNTFTGGITVSGGTLVIPSTGSIPSNQDLVMSGGVFRILDGGPGGSVFLNSLSGSVATSSIDTFTTDSNPATDLATSLIVVQNSNSTYAGRINDVFSTNGPKSRLSFVKAGSGILTLSNESSFYRGTTNIVEGALAVTKLSLYSAGNSSIGFGDFTVVPNSADSLVMATGTSLIYVGTLPSVTDRSFTIGTGPSAGAVYANGTTAGATLEFMEYYQGVGDPSNERIQFDTPDTPATLTLGGRNTGSNIFGSNLSDNGSGMVSLVKTGPGTWILNNTNGSNSYSGSTTIYEGRLVITGDGALGSKGPSGPPVQLVGGVLDLRNVNYTASAGNVENLRLMGGRLDATLDPVSLVGSSTWAGSIEIVVNSAPNVNVARNATLTLNSITGIGGLDKDNFGTLILAGANGYTGGTRIRDGAVVLDYTATPGDNKLADGTTLTFGGGRTGGILELKNLSASPVAETVGGTTLERGSHEIRLDNSSTSPVTINLKAISRQAGALLDIETGGIAFTSNANNVANDSGILGAWATIAHSDWARKDSNVAALNAAIVPVTNYIIDTWQAANPNNTDARNSISQANATTNTLRFNQPSTPVTVTLSGVNTLMSGGILVTPNVAAVNQIVGGSLTAGTLSGSPAELVIQQFSTNAGFVIDSQIIDRPSPSATVGVQKLGPGVLALTGANSYTGITTIADGILLATTLTDGGVPSSVGQAGVAAGNIVIGGGTLEYGGTTTTINRGMTIKEFGQLSVGNEDTVLTISGDASSAAFGNIVGDSGTAVWQKGGSGTLRVLRLESGNATSGTQVSGIQELDVSDGKLLLQYGYSTTPSTPSSPAPPNATDRLINNSVNLTVSGGKLELIGDDYVFNNGTGSQRFLGQFHVAPGASEIQVTSQTSLNPLAVQNTVLEIGDVNNLQDIVRDLGGTVLFVVNPNGGQVSLALHTGAQDQGEVLPWATYWNKNNTAQPGVNNFAAIEQTDDTVVSADSKSLYSTKSRPFDWNNDGLEHISEEGGIPFGFDNPGTPVGVDDSLISPNSSIATLRFFNDNGEGHLTIGTGDTLTLTNGAILLAANIKNNQKTLTGGTLTSTYLTGDNKAELIIHNYNPLLAFRLESSIADPTSLPTSPALNLVHTGTGTTSLFAANTYTGTTYVTGGVLKLEHAQALPGGIGATGGTSPLTIDGGVIGLTSASGDFTRPLGTGASQVQWTSSGGFAAYGVDRNVNIGGAGAQLNWGFNGFVPSGDTLVLSSADADKRITVQNPINLGIISRIVRVENGRAAEDATLSGVLTGAGALIKNGEGALRLTAANTHLGGVILAEGTLYVPSPSVLGTGDLNVATNSNTTANDAPTLVLEGGSISNTLTVGNQNLLGITNIEVPNDVTLNGTVSLQKSGIFVGPDVGKALTVSNVVSGSGGLTLVDGGTVVLRGANTYGSAGAGAGTLINGSTIIRNGTVTIESATALGDGTKALELGDAMTAPVAVDRATVGVSLLLGQGSFDPTGNGIPGSQNGIGAFYDVSSTLDGKTYTSLDAGTLILVKDEVENPERNGVYKIVFGVSQTAGTMNLTRVDTGGFPLAPSYVNYGTDISVTNGTVNAGATFFLAAPVDTADINVDGFYWKPEVSLNPNVALTLGIALSAPVTNPIDINATNGTGTTSIGYAASVVHGSSTLSGSVTLQSQSASAENKNLLLSAGGGAELIFSGAVTDPGTNDKLSLVKNGTGVVTLSGTNSFDGTATVNAGVLKLDNVAALGGTLGANNAGSGNLIIAGGVVGVTTASGNLTRTLGSGDGQVKWATASSGGFAAYGTNQSVTINGGPFTWGTTPNFIEVNQSLILGAPTATAKVNFTSAINLGNAPRNVNVPNGPAAVEGELSGSLTVTGTSGSLLKTGQGALLVSGANVYTAATGTTLAQGTLQGKRLASGSVFGTTAIAVGGTATQFGDALKLEFLGDDTSNTTYSVSNTITIGTQNRNGTDRNGITSIDATHGAGVTNVVDVDLTAALALPRDIFVGPDANAKLQMSGVVSGVGRMTVVDGGSLRLTNTNTYGTGATNTSGTAITGGTIIRNGTIEVNVAGSLGSTLVELGDARTNIAVTVDRASGGMALTDNGANFSAGTFTGVATDFGGGSYTVADIGKNLLVKDENANPERNGIYQITSVTGTDMVLTRVSQFDNVGGTEMVYGSTVQVTNGPVPGQNYFMASPTVTTVNTSPVIWRDTAANPNVALLASAAITINNNIDLNASGSTGTMTIGAVSTLTTGTVTFGGTITQQNLTGSTENLVLDISSALIDNSATGLTFSGVIADGVESLQVRKVGAGVATLSSAANTYHGGTLVNAGVLLVNNTNVTAPSSGTGTGAVTTLAGSGAILGGTGSINGLTTINNGTFLKPGTGVSNVDGDFDSTTASLAFTGGLTLASGSTVEWQLNGTTSDTQYDQVQVTGTLTVDLFSALKVFLGFAPVTNVTFDILDWTTLNYGGTDIANQLSFPDSNPSNWDTSNFKINGTITYIVPEPSRLMLVFLGSLLCVLRRKRK